VKVYRVTRQVMRSHHGHREVGKLIVKTVTPRSLSAMLRCENAGEHPTLKTIQIESAEIGPWADVTRDFLDES
jgi:hypothetical protein